MLTRQAGNADSWNGKIQTFNYYNTLIPTHTQQSTGLLVLN